MSSFTFENNDCSQSKETLNKDYFHTLPQDSSSLNDNHRIHLMEKDKIIFEYSKTLKETENVLDNTKKLNLAKKVWTQYCYACFAKRLCWALGRYRSYLAKIYTGV